MSDEKTALTETSAPVRQVPAWEEDWPSRLPGAGGSYRVGIYIGKDADLVALKWRGVASFTESAARYRASRERMRATIALERVGNCPVCGVSVASSRPVMEVYGLSYHRCSECTHGFAVVRPTTEATRAFYAADPGYAATYTDRETHQLRLQEIYRPKVEWVVGEYRRLWGREPRRLLDVGAGAGHFVAACRGLGLEAEGIEPNESDVRFGREVFGLDLRAIDFLDVAHRLSGFDVVTFWGVIEHHADPLTFLAAGRRTLAGERALVVVEVPHLASFGTAVQMLFPTSVVRHCDPFSHLHIFSEQSLALAFERCGFAPAAAWYFGMDAFELVSQVALAATSDDLFSLVAARIGAMQAALDRNKLSDSLVLAGRPGPP